MKRRAFIAGLASALAWPIALRAQQSERLRLIGVLFNLGEDNEEDHARNVAFTQALERSGWVEGKNVRIERRFSPGDPKRIRKNAEEMVSLAPDVIVASGGASLTPLLQLTQTIPVVFTIVPDPVGMGFVESLARPGGNATGFVQFEYGLTGKWLELLQQIAPTVTRVGVLREPGLTAALTQFAALQAAALPLGLDLVALNARNAAEIQHALTSYVRSPADGLIVTSGPLMGVHRDLIVREAARHKLPAVYVTRYMAAAGGLVSYGPDFVDQYRRAAGYVDRVLKGEQPADLPVQAPTKYELVINLKTAKALGLTIPTSLLARADEVIE
jgi:putative ABC transport system substrate-binding protein